MLINKEVINLLIATCTITNDVDFPFIKNVIKTKSIPTNACFLHSIKAKDTRMKIIKIGIIRNLKVSNDYVFYLCFYFPSFIPK